MLYLLDIKRVRFVTSRGVPSAFVADLHGFFQAPADLPCDFFTIANFLKIGLVLVISLSDGCLKHKP